MKQKIWLFDSPYEATELEADLLDNRITWGEYSWNVVNYPPIVVKKGGLFRKKERIYFVTPTSSTPRYPQYIDLKPEPLDAKAIRSLLEQRFIANLLKPVRKPLQIDNTLYLILGIALGVIVLWVLKLFGIRII